MLRDEDLAAFRAQLERQLEELAAQDAATAESRRPVELDQQSTGRLTRMDALQQQAMAKATEQRRRVAAGRIRAALKRLDEDEYGDCVRCGEEIPIARLRLDPATAVCVPCLENEGG